MALAKDLFSGINCLDAFSLRRLARRVVGVRVSPIPHICPGVNPSHPLQSAS